VRAPFPDVPTAVIDPHDIAAVAAVALREVEQLTGRQPATFRQWAEANAEQFQ
jgi:hypothetical protein